ncbi:MAG TPA: serine/threonine-protein kinase, partial [Thermoanaerobaculia bacterium]
MTEPGAAAGSGEHIGAYEIQGPLGRGGMGEVFLAWDNRLKRRVAIKRIRPDHGPDSVPRQRLLREARAAAGLSHPAIVQVYDLIEDATGDSIVLEYVEGRTLAAILAGTGPLDPVAAVRLTCEIAGGLAAAHAAGIVHRDLQTDNVIVTPAGHAKILDFGLAQMRVRPVDDAFVTQQGVLLGTFHAMSPEQASGEEIDERSDLFALGILLYETLTGCSPFRGSSPAETLGRVLFQRPPRVDAVNPGVPGWLGELVERLLAKEPGERPESAAEVARELETMAAYLASSATPQGSSTGDLPTVVDVPRPMASQPVLSFRASDPPSDLSIPGHPGDGKRKRRAIAALLAMAVLGGALSLGIRPLIDRISGAPAATSPLRVLVLQPRVNGRGERLQLAALGARLTSVSTLGSLEGVAAIDEVSAGLPGNPSSPKEMAQAAAANEVLVVAMEEVGGRGKITLTRRDAKGRRLWDETLDASFGNGDLIKLAQEVDKSLLRGYSERALRPGTPTLTARTEDYATFLAVRQRL